LLEAGHLDEALEEARSALAGAFNDDPTLLVAAAQVLVSAGDPAEAASCLRRASRADPLDASVHHDLAVVLARQGDFDEALHHLRAALELDPSDVTTYQSLAELLWRLGKYRAALEFLRRASLALPAPELYLLLARAAALARAPVIAQEAVDWLRAHTDSSAQRCLDLGSIYMSLGNLAGAEREYREAVELAPEQAAIHHAVATLFVEQGDATTAELAFRAALEQDPSYWPSLNDLGLLLLSLGRPEEAVQLLRQAVTLRSGEATSRLNLALALLSAGSRAAALQHARAALSLAEDEDLRGEAALLLRRLLQQDS